jgi:hypothetical protein
LVWFLVSDSVLRVCIGIFVILIDTGTNHTVPVNALQGLSGKSGITGIMDLNQCTMKGVLTVITVLQENTRSIVVVHLGASARHAQHVLLENIVIHVQIHIKASVPDVGLVSTLQLRGLHQAVIVKIAHLRPMLL